MVGRLLYGNVLRKSQKSIVNQPLPRQKALSPRPLTLLLHTRVQDIPLQPSSYPAQPKTPTSPLPSFIPSPHNFLPPELRSHLVAYRLHLLLPQTPSPPPSNPSIFEMPHLCARNTRDRHSPSVHMQAGIATLWVHCGVVIIELFNPL